MKRLMLACVMILCLLPAIAIAEPDENIPDTWFAARGEDGLYGFIDRQGEWMIAPQYVFADTYFPVTISASVWMPLAQANGKA